MKKEEIKVIEIRINELAKAWYKASQNSNRVEEKRIRREERNIEKYLFENHYLIDIRKENGVCSLYVRQMWLTREGRKPFPRNKEINKNGKKVHKKTDKRRIKRNAQ